MTQTEQEATRGQAEAFRPSRAAFLPLGIAFNEKTGAYPYYVQRVPHSIFEVSGKKVTEMDFVNGFTRTVEEEGFIFEAMIQGLSLQQTKLISALAE